MRKATLLILLAAVALVAAGMAAGPAMAGKPFACFKSGVGAGQVAPEAQVTTLYCFYKKFDGVKSLHVKIGVKNLSKVEQRFRVNIFMPDGKAAGGLIPQKTKKGLVKPGSEGKFVYPIKGYGGSTDGMEIYVRTMAK